MTQRSKVRKLPHDAATMIAPGKTKSKRVRHAPPDITERKQIKEGLRKSEEMYHQLFTTAQDGILILDAVTGNITNVNPFLTRMLGYSSKEMIGKKLWEIGAFKDVERSHVAFKKLQRERYIRYEDLPLETKDGKSMSVEFVSNAYKVAGKTVIQCNIRDITERKRAEDNLRESEIRYKNLFDNVGDGVFVRDLQGHLLEVNSGICERLGYSRDELLHMTIQDIISPEYVSLLAKRNEEIQRQGHLTFETAYVSRDGKVIPTEISSRIIQYKNQLRVLSTARDITERKRMSEAIDVARQYAENIVSTVRDPLIVMNSDLRIISANPSFYENFKVNPTETEGKTLYEIGNRQWDNPELRRLLEEILPAKSVINDFELIHAFPTIGQKVMLLNARKVQAEVGKEPFILLAIEDITERKRLEEMKVQFLSHVTHELRTPLGPLKVHLDYAVAEKLGPLSEKLKSSLQAMKRSVDRLHGLTNELLDLRRIQAGRFQLNCESMNFRKVLDESIQAQTDQKQRVHLKVTEGPLPVRGDQTRLRQALTNLLNNASKYTPEEGAITIKVDGDGDTIKCQISDTGIGIRKEDLPKVFEPFSNIKKPSTIQTAGIGLSITKGIIEAHGGKIWAESEGEGKGATFTFTLPKPKEDA